ncbi:MAG TPA: type IV pilus assembly protein PilM [Planctomycetota bacterium]|nr:type IV pilus assembly protein PilM [Planctomycetota bacterium]
MARGVWGIDVSKFSMKAVRLEAGPSGMVLTQVGIMPYEGTDTGEAVNLDSEIRHSLAELKVRLKIGSERVVLSLPGHSTFNRLIKLPPVEDSKLAEVVRYEAQSQIPFPIDEVIWDYQFVERVYSPGEEKEVILFAIKKEIVEQFLANIQDLGLNVEAIQFAPVALYNFLSYDQDIGTTCIAVDMGADNADLLVVDGPKFWIRNLPITGNDITKSLQKAFNVSFAEAEKLKRKAASTPQAQKIFNAAQPVIRDLIGEVHRSIGYYKSISKQVKFEKVLVLGNASRFVNFQKFVSQTLQMPAMRVTKLNRIAVGGNLEPANVAEDLTSISTAIGLALQGWDETNNRVNLLPPAFQKRREMKRKQPLVATATVLLLVLVGAMWLMGSSEVGALNEKKAVGEVLKKDIVTAKTKFETAKKEAGRLVAPLQQLESLLREKDLILKVMNEIHLNIPDNGSPTYPSTAKIWILDWEVQDLPLNPPARDSGKGAVTPGREWDPSRKLVVRMEIAVEGAGRKDEGISTIIIKELLGVTETAPHRKIQGKKGSVVTAFKLGRQPLPPKFEVAIKGRTDELKPSRVAAAARSEGAPATTPGKYVLVEVTLEIPTGHASEKPAETPKEPEKK